MMEGRTDIRGSIKRHPRGRGGRSILQSVAVVITYINVTVIPNSESKQIRLLVS